MAVAVRPPPSIGPPAVLAVASLALLGAAAAGGMLGLGRVEDSARYERIAARLSRGDGYSSCPSDAPALPELERMPGYPTFIAATRALTVRDEGLLVAQALLHALGAASLLLLATRLTGRPGLGLAVALAWALDPFALYYARCVLSETLASEALVVGLAGVVMYATGASRAWWIVAASGLGVATMTRPALIGLPFLLTGVALARDRGRCAHALLVASAVVFLLQIAWTARNWAALGVPSIGAHNFFGYNLCRASVEHAMPAGEAAAYCHLDRADAALSACDPAEGRHFDALFRGAAEAAIEAHPLRFALVSAFRAVRIWITWDVPLVVRVATLALLPPFLVGAVRVARANAHGWMIPAACAYVALAHMFVVCASSRYTLCVRGLYLVAVVQALAEGRAFLRSARRSAS